MFGCCSAKDGTEPSKKSASMDTTPDDAPLKIPPVVIAETSTSSPPYSCLIKPADVATVVQLFTNWFHRVWVISAPADCVDRLVKAISFS